MFHHQSLFYLFIVFQLSFGNRFNISDILPERHNPKKRCEPVTVPFCRDIGYNETVFPNLLQHGSQHNAGMELHRLSPLIKVNCSDDTKLLLCSVFFPPCTILESPLPPCRSVCDSVKSGCESVVMAFGYGWPEYLECNNFPEFEPCVSRTGSLIPGSNHTSTLKPAFTGNPVVNRFVCPVHLITPKVAGYVLRLNGQIYHNCATPCDGLLFNQHDRMIIRGWIFICSIICLISSLFTLFTHLLEPKRFSYPEKTLRFLAICYAVIALVHIIGFLFGDQISCNEPFPPPQSNLDAPMIRTITQGSSKATCTLTFMFLYFFSHSSYIWFTIMTYTWFIVFTFGWAREGFERKATLFHGLAWAIPLFEAIRILAMKRIEGDPLSGVCYRDFWNRDVHQFYTDSNLYLFYLGVSFVFLVIGGYFSYRAYQVLKADNRDTYKMVNLLCRVSIFSIFYLLSSATLIGCNIYETFNLDPWMLDWQQNICNRPESGIPCPVPTSDIVSAKPNINFFIVKYAARLVPGMTISLHLFSRKTLDSWLNFIRKLWNRLLCIDEPTEDSKSVGD